MSVALFSFTFFLVWGGGGGEGRGEEGEEGGGEGRKEEGWGIELFHLLDWWES